MERQISYLALIKNSKTSLSMSATFEQALMYGGVAFLGAFSGKIITMILTRNNKRKWYIPFLLCLYIICSIILLTITSTEQFIYDFQNGFWENNQLGTLCHK